MQSKDRKNPKSAEAYQKARAAKNAARPMVNSFSFESL